MDYAVAFDKRKRDFFILLQGLMDIAYFFHRANSLTWMLKQGVHKEFIAMIQFLQTLSAKQSYFKKIF